MAPRVRCRVSLVTHVPKPVDHSSTSPAWSTPLAHRARDAVGSLSPCRNQSVPAFRHRRRRDRLAYRRREFHRNAPPSRARITRQSRRQAPRPWRAVRRTGFDRRSHASLGWDRISMMPILTADSVVKSFGGHRVLTAATLRVVPGELRVLFGRNGIGKSTLLKIAAGWLSPDSGTIHFAGRAYLSVSLTDLAAARLFYLPDHDLLSTAFTVRQQLEMICLQFPGGNVRDAASQLGIAAHLDKY